jgi:hypothetical protein
MGLHHQQGDTHGERERRERERETRRATFKRRERELCSGGDTRREREREKRQSTFKKKGGNTNLVPACTAAASCSASRRDESSRQISGYRPTRSAIARRSVQRSSAARRSTLHRGEREKGNIQVDRRRTSEQKARGERAEGTTTERNTDRVPQHRELTLITSKMSTAFSTIPFTRSLSSCASACVHSVNTPWKFPALCRCAMLACDACCV